MSASRRERRERRSGPVGRGADQTRGAAPPNAQGALALFPGMAAAFPGMGRALVGTPDGRRTFREFGRWSGLDVAAAASDVPESDLFRDRTWELSVIATEAAALAAWRASGGVVAASLGFSIGAYAALLSAGALSIEQVVSMVDIVLEASRLLPGRYAMFGASGTTLEKVEVLCVAGEVEVSAVVVPGQVLIAGAEAAVRALAERLAPDVLRIRLLPVRWPLHTSLMRGVSDELERRWTRIGGLRPFRHPVYSAMHGGRIETPEEGWRLLVDHLHRPQRFDLAFAAALADGVGRCVEFGPGGTLSGAVRWMARDEIEVETFPTGGPRERTRTVRG